MTRTLRVLFRCCPCLLEGGSSFFSVPRRTQAFDARQQAIRHSLPCIFVRKVVESKPNASPRPAYGRLRHFLMNPYSLAAAIGAIDDDLAELPVLDRANEPAKFDANEKASVFVAAARVHDPHVRLVPLEPGSKTQIMGVAGR